MIKGIPVPENDWQSLNIRLDEIAKELKKITASAVTNTGVTIDENEGIVTTTPIQENPGPPANPESELPMINNFRCEPESTEPAPVYGGPNYCVPLNVTIYWEVSNAIPPIKMTRKGMENPSPKTMYSPQLQNLTGSLVQPVFSETIFALTATNLKGESVKQIVFAVGDPDVIPPEPPPDTKPPTPTFLSGQGLTLSTPVWVAALRRYKLDATVTFTGNSECVRYEIEFYNTTASPDELDHTMTILGDRWATSQAFTGIYHDNQANINYSVRVRSYKSGSDIPSDWSESKTASAATYVKTPNAPTMDATVTKIGQLLKWTWVAPTTNTDTSAFSSSEIQKYQFYASKTGSFNPDSGPPGDMKTIEGLVTQATIIASNDSETWHGKVRVVNGWGTASGFSAEVDSASEPSSWKLINFVRPWKLSGGLTKTAGVAGATTSKTCNASKVMVLRGYKIEGAGGNPSILNVIANNTSYVIKSSEPTVTVNYLNCEGAYTENKAAPNNEGFSITCPAGVTVANNHFFTLEFVQDANITTVVKEIDNATSSYTVTAGKTLVLTYAIDTSGGSNFLQWDNSGSWENIIDVNSDPIFGTKVLELPAGIEIQASAGTMVIFGYEFTA